MPQSGGEVGEVQKEEKKKEEKPRLNLTVMISRDGFAIAGSGGLLKSLAPEGKEGPTIPKKPDGTYDYEKLSQVLVEIKKMYPYEQDVILIPEMEFPPGDPTKKNIPLQVIVDTMDVLRELPEPLYDFDGDGKKDKFLFPGIVFAAGVF
jgi:hypothetical protein